MSRHPNSNIKLANAFVEVDKVSFLAKVAALEAFTDGRYRRPNKAGEVRTAFMVRSGQQIGQVLADPRRPYSRPPRYFLQQSGTEGTHECTRV